MTVPCMGDAAIMLAVGLGMVFGALIMLVAGASMVELRVRSEREELRRKRAGLERLCKMWEIHYAPESEPRKPRKQRRHFG